MRYTTIAAALAIATLGACSGGGSAPSGGSIALVPDAQSLARLPDSVGDARVPHHVYVGNATTNAITIYGVNANGNVAPTRTIGGSRTGILCLNQTAVDASGYVYVASAPVPPIASQAACAKKGESKILVFAPGANGNVAPVRTIAGPATQIDTATAVAVDTDGTVYVGSYEDRQGGADTTLLRFAPGASGNVAPTASSFFGSQAVDGLTLDKSAGLLVSFFPGAPSFGDASISYVPKTLSRGSGEIQWVAPGPLASDPATKTYLALVGQAYFPQVETTVYRLADGTTGAINSPGGTVLTPPLVSSFSVATCPVALATDTTRTIYVVGQAVGCAADSVGAFSPNGTPLRQISGPATQLAAPTYVTVGL